MFTGIVEEVGKVKEITSRSESVEIWIQCSFADELRVDQSVSINGVCLTVTRTDDSAFSVQCIEETMRKTSIGTLEEGDPVNLERSMTLDKGIDGHLVQGHVDCIAEIVDVTNREDDRLYRIEIPTEDADLVVPRGSITIDGISLTIARLNPPNQLTVAIIPYTYNHTNLRNKEAGDRVNIEYDIIGKYVVRYLQNRESSDRDSSSPPDSSQITKEWLRDEGY